MSSWRSRRTACASASASWTPTSAGGTTSAPRRRWGRKPYGQAHLASPGASLAIRPAGGSKAPALSPRSLGTVRLVFHRDQDGSNGNPPPIGPLLLIEAVAGDQGHPGLLFMAENVAIVGPDDLDRSNLIDVLQPPGVHQHPIAVAQPAPLLERPRKAIRQHDVPGNHAVALPGGKRSPHQVPGLVVQPRHVPSALTQGHS